MITIALADDHPVVQNGIPDMLQSCPHIHNGATYHDGPTLLAGLAFRLPDVLLLDMQVPGLNGEELVFLIRKKYPRLPILILAGFDNMLYVNNMLRNGASGYLLRNTDRDTLVMAIEEVYAGRGFLLPDMKERLELFRNRLSAKNSRRYVLTPREKDILELLARGLTSREIAEKLLLSQRTVESYRFNLSVKLEARNTPELLRKARDMELLEQGS